MYLLRQTVLFAPWHNEVSHHLQQIGRVFLYQWLWDMYLDVVGTLIIFCYKLVVFGKVIMYVIWIFFWFCHQIMQIKILANCINAILIHFGNFQFFSWRTMLVKWFGGYQGYRSIFQLHGCDLRLTPYKISFVCQHIIKFLISYFLIHLWFKLKPPSFQRSKRKLEHLYVVETLCLIGGFKHWSPYKITYVECYTIRFSYFPTFIDCIYTTMFVFY